MIAEMEIELYLSEYLSKSVAEIMDNCMIYTTLELPDFFESSIRFFQKYEPSISAVGDYTR